ncbi:MAG: type II toxin-antitoxin system RelE/ParE family toxin [Anaerolineae bacterium]|nr:type II toxin-antitoxin system RelE/ParE family toxin [Anaerolineae bacterium]
MYRVAFVASAAKEFRSLDTETKRRVATEIETLRKNPRHRGVRKLRGHKHIYRVRVGSHRVVYEIEDETRLVRVTRIRHRREVYR